MGPEIPYVIKRLFKIEGMVCVMSQADLICGYTYYGLGYYAENPPLPQDVKLGNYVKEYHGSFDTHQDSWELDFHQWVESGQVRWAKHEQGKLQLQPAGVEGFPFLDLPGHRGEQYAKGDEVEFAKPPRERSSKYSGY